MRNILAGVVCTTAVFFGGCTADGTTAPSPSVLLQEAGWSFGFCIGACRGQLTLDGAELVYRVSDRTGDQPIVENRGRLTSVGSARLATLTSALPGDLLDTYGCPDCADAGAAYVVVRRESGTERAEYEYPNPPSELAALDAFLKSVMEALGRCRPTSDVSVGQGCNALPS